MKKLHKSLTLLAFVAGLASCNNVAEFKTEAFVTFSGTSYSVKENAGEIKIPVNLVSSKPLTTTVSYQITGGDALEDKHYTMPNKSGVIRVSTDPAKCDSIIVCPIDSTGTFTNNKTIEFTLQQATENGVQIGNTTTCLLTIIDIDAALNLLVGHWIGSELPVMEGTPGTIEFDLAICEEGESEYYPDANLKIPADGLTVVDARGNSPWGNQIPLYLYFDKDKNEIQLYPEQIFDVGFFGDEIGYLFISLDLESTFKNSDPQPVIFKVNDEVMTLANDVWLPLWTESSFSGFKVGCFLANGEIRKQ